MIPAKSVKKLKISAKERRISVPNIRNSKLYSVTCGTQPWDVSDRMPETLRICLMSCCAPCSAGAIVQLAKDGADFVVLFYNPNISPESEYQKRLSEQIRLCESMNVKYFVGEYNHDAWLSCVRGLEDEPERGRRCAECFKLRIAWGARWAREHGYNALATVFGVSRWKDQKQVDAAALSCPLEGRDRVAYKQSELATLGWGDNLQPVPPTQASLDSQARQVAAVPPLLGAGGVSIVYISPVWDESLRVAENKKHNFYRQKYCGCEFSINNKTT